MVTVFVAEVTMVDAVVVVSATAASPAVLFTKLLFGTELVMVAIGFVGGSSPGKITVVFFFL